MRKAKVLMVNPNRMCPPIAPIALDYLAESLRWHGYDPCLCDLAFSDDWEWDLEVGPRIG